MRLSSSSSQFVFNLPSDFLSTSVSDSYLPILEKNWVQYENVIDYLNSTIKEISAPGLSVETPTQRVKRGKEINFKPATNVNDIMASRELDITFRSVDSDLNYWLLWEMFINHYLNVEEKFLKPFILQAIDIHRDVIYEISFREVILKTLSELRFAYNDQAFTEKTFTMTFSFNFIEIEFKLDKSKVLELDKSELPIIVQKIGGQL